MTTTPTGPTPTLAARLWAKVREPKSITIQLAALYLLIGVAGLVSITNPPNSVDSALGGGYTAVWSWAMCLGGFGAAIFTPSGAWLWERPFLIIVTGSGLLYLWSAIIQATNATGGNRWVQIAWITAAIIQLGVRLQRIFREPYEPGR